VTLKDQGRLILSESTTVYSAVMGQIVRSTERSLFLLQQKISIGIQ